MSSKRKMNYKKYGISRNRYNELRFFCLQYSEWKKRIAEIDNQAKGCDAETLIERTELAKKVALIDETAEKACDDLAWALIDNVCGHCSFVFLSTSKRVPISEPAFYEKRRYFFYLLSKAKT